MPDPVRCAYADRELALRAAILRRDLEECHEICASKMIKLVGGDPEREAVLLGFLHQLTEYILACFSAPVEFPVPDNRPPGSARRRLFIVQMDPIAGAATSAKGETA